MLDVHPPHESARTWTDFFIHIATICVGLLIEGEVKADERMMKIDQTRFEDPSTN